MGSIRPLNFETDLPRVAEIINQVDLEPVTVDQLHEWWTRETEGEICQRAVLTGLEGEIVAYGMTRRQPWDKPGRFWLALKVDEARRRQGFGSRLYDHLTAFALDHGGPPQPAHRQGGALGGADGGLPAVAAGRGH